MNMPTRKQQRVTTPFIGKNVPVITALYALSFVAANWYAARGQLELTEYVASSYGYSLTVPTGISGYIVTLIVSALTSFVVCEPVMKIYYFFAYRYMRGLLPFSVKEFKCNLRPFLAVKNVALGLLSLLCLTEDGYFIVFGLNMFDMLLTMITIFPFYFYMKKRYIADGYGGRVLVAFAVPFIVFNAITYVTLLV